MTFLAADFTAAAALNFFFFAFFAMPSACLKLA